MADHSPCVLQQQTENEVVETGLGGVPKGPYNPGNPVFTCTEEFPTPDAPEPTQDDWFQGYGSKPQHAMYRTSASDVGRLPPTVHTMPTSFHCKSQKFSEHLGKCGTYRNHSMNTALDKSKV